MRWVMRGMRGVLWTAAGLACAAALFFAVSAFTPRLAAYATRAAFSRMGKGPQYPRAADFSARAREVTVLTDIAYPSADDHNTMDILRPAHAEGERLPVLFWVHGGGFVGGDKADVLDYMTLLAAEGMVVVSINYALAPEARYPSPILQLRDAYAHVAAQADAYGIDLRRVALGGDSAGASIVGQFVCAQVDPAYAEASGLPQAVASPEDIRGVVFLSGLLCVNLEQASGEDRGLVRTLYNKTIWAYYDEKHWQRGAQAGYADLPAHVSPAFPPTFITDGRVGSFETQARALDAALRALGVPVESHFYDADLPHEYQFDMTRPASLETYAALRAFLAARLQA